MTGLEFDLRIKELGLSRKQFAELAGVSYMAISTNWKKDKEIPSWVEPFLTYYEKGRKLDEVLALIKTYAKDL